MGDKRVYVSDLHMSETVGIRSKGKPPHPYGWFNASRARRFGDFLEQMKADRKVKEVFILGDLFDNWICPIGVKQQDAETQYKNILDAPHNRPATEAMRMIAKKSSGTELIYVPGNHDMSVTGAMMRRLIPGIKYRGTYERPGEGKFVDGELVAEHGHSYCLFNAPDSVSKKSSALPLGYFISRVVADQQERTNKKTNEIKALINIIKNLGKSYRVPERVFKAIVKEAGLNGKSNITMSNQHGYNMKQISVAVVRKQFKKVYKDWKKNNPNNVGGFIALLAEAGHLSNTAKIMHFGKKAARKKIVIFGHSHKPSFRQFNSRLRLIQSQPDSPDDSETPEYIYVNSGAWASYDAKKCTFVETERKGKRHYVRLKNYKKNGDIVLYSPTSESYVVNKPAKKVVNKP